MKILFVAMIVSALFLVTISNSHAVAADDLVKQAEQFVDQLDDAEFKKATSDFDEAMSAAMPAEKLAPLWESLEESLGEFQRRAGSRTEQAGKYQLVYVTCVFADKSMDVRVVFDEEQKIAGLFFVKSKPKAESVPPDYADQSNFTEQQVTFGAEPWVLPGTLSIPNSDGPFAAIVLVHGSGPNDRDETVAANKPFKDLALGLSSREIVVLRYDKRTKVYGQQLAKGNGLTVKQETIDDVLAAVDSLKSHAKVDAQQIYVAGHSLGGYLVPRIAKADRNGSIAGYVMLAANARPIQELIWEQSNYLLKLDGSLSAAEQAHLNNLRPQIDLIDGKQLVDAKQSDRILGAGPAYWIDLRDYDPTKVAAEHLKKPTLILQGERDYQVTLTDFNAWKSALDSHENVSFKTYPKLNHLFIAGEGPGNPTEYETPGHVAAEVMNDIADWIPVH